MIQESHFIFRRALAAVPAPQSFAKDWGKFNLLKLRLLKAMIRNDPETDLGIKELASTLDPWLTQGGFKI